MTQQKSNIIQYNEYYPFGLQASTSWTRESNSNNYLYNAANELNQNTGWYEMFYRGYDPALGRMLQVDPLATSYASHTPYNYGINSPLFFNDPLGAQSEAPPGVSQIGWDRYNKINDRNNPNYFSDWADSFGGGGTIYITENRRWVTDRSNPTTVDPSPTYLVVTYSVSSISYGGDWEDLYKSDLADYAESIGRCTNCDSNQLGSLFEDIFEATIRSDPKSKGSNFRRNTNRIFALSDRNTKPDFTADAIYIPNTPNGSTLPSLRAQKLRVPEGTWYEIKAKESKLYVSSNQGQLRGHIDNLVEHTANFRKSHPGFMPGLYVITTADISSLSKSISNYGLGRVSLMHATAQFRIVNGEYQFRFVGQ